MPDDAEKRDAVERMLNDPDVAMDPALVWSLLEELREVEEAANPA